MRDLITWISFQANRDFIADVLCINQEKPITVCGGSCYLQIQLDENHREEKSPSNIKIVSENVTFLTESAIDLDLQQKSFAYKSDWLMVPESDLSSGYIHTVFRPPIV